MGILATIYYVYILLVPLALYLLTWEQLLISYLVFWFLGDFIHGLFLHRWAAHKLWSPPIWLQNSLSIISTASLVGTPITWSSWHRTHHHYSDTKKDPHSPKYKSWPYIVFKSYFHYSEPKRCIDRLRNKFINKLTQNCGIVALLINLLLFLSLEWTWFLSLWVLPVVATNFFTNWGINVLCHKEGNARNRLELYPIIFNECYHGNHHVEPELRYYKYDFWVSLITLMGWSKKEV